MAVEFVVPRPVKVAVGNEVNAIEDKHISRSLTHIQNMFNAQSDAMEEAFTRLGAGYRAAQSPWIGDIDGNGFHLRNAGSLGVYRANTAGADAVAGLSLDRYYGDVGDSMDIVFGSQTPGNRLARISANVFAGGEGAIIFHAQTGAGDGANNEVMRMQGNGRVGIGTNNPGSKLDIVAPGGYVSFAASNAGAGTFDISAVVANTNASAAVQAGILRVQAVNDSASNVLMVAISAAGARFAVFANGTIQMWLGGSFKTLSVDGAGFVKAT